MILGIVDNFYSSPYVTEKSCSAPSGLPMDFYSSPHGKYVAAMLTQVLFLFAPATRRERCAKCLLSKLFTYFYSFPSCDGKGLQTSWAVQVCNFYSFPSCDGKGIVVDGCGRRRISIHSCHATGKQDFADELESYENFYSFPSCDGKHITGSTFHHRIHFYSFPPYDGKRPRISMHRPSLIFLFLPAV